MLWNLVKLNLIYMYIVWLKWMLCMEWTKYTETVHLALAYVCCYNQWLTQFSLGFGRFVRCEGWTLALVVNGDDPEDVLIVHGQVTDRVAGHAWLHLLHFVPVCPSGVSYLDNVLGQFGSTVWFRRLPRQVSRVQGDIWDLQRAFRGTWWICKQKDEDVFVTTAMTFTLKMHQTDLSKNPI